MTFKIALHTLSLPVSSPALCQFPFLCSVHTSQAFADWVGPAHKLVISSPCCSWFLWLLPALNTHISLLCTSALLNMEVKSLEAHVIIHTHCPCCLREKDFYSPKVIAILRQAKITQAFAISHFKAELSVASQAVFRLGK